MDTQEGSPAPEAEAAHGHTEATATLLEGYPPKSISANKASYFLDVESLETDPEVYPFEIPSFENAEKLFQAYIRSCHNSFPLLAKKAFTHQFYHCTFSKNDT